MELDALKQEVAARATKANKEVDEVIPVMRETLLKALASAEESIVQGVDHAKDASSEAEDAESLAANARDEADTAESNANDARSAADEAADKACSAQEAADEAHSVLEDALNTIRAIKVQLEDRS